MIQVWTNSELDGEIDTHDYNIEEHADGVKVLYTSENVNWTKKNKQLMSLEDTGNKIILSIEGMDENIVLDYTQEVELLALLLSNVNDRVELRATQVIKVAC